ncbi:MAG: LysR family transcriptional regulator, partial [Bdellovibrionales bacterium]|nr:LysR family transcriptional regulator [Bdellovibrionales bacterium]
GFYAKRIAKMPVVVCGSKKFAKLKQGFLESLRNQPFVMPSHQSRLRHDVDHFPKLNDIEVDVKAEVQDTSLQKLVCMHGDGLIPISLPAARDLIANKGLCHLGVLPDTYEELWLAAAHRRIQNPVAAALMQYFVL